VQETYLEQKLDYGFKPSCMKPELCPSGCSPAAPEQRTEIYGCEQQELGLGRRSPGWGLTQWFERVRCRCFSWLV